jgi:hypothetical protein
VNLVDFKRGDWGEDGMDKGKKRKENKEGMYEYGVTGAVVEEASKAARIGDRIEWKCFAGACAARRGRRVRKHEDWIDWVLWFVTGLYWMGLVRS